ncbi:hypothetical protein Tco_0500482, partial [Tanacetum coccineum]
VSDRCKYVHHRASHVGKPTQWNAQNHPQMQHVICGTIPLRATGSVWGHFGDVGPERLRPSDIKLFLVAFDSQFKVFHPLKNDNASGKHPQCHIQVKKVIFFQIGELFLNQEKKHVFNIMQIKSWEVSFLELVELMIFSSNFNLFQIPVIILLHNFDMGYCNDSFSGEYIMRGPSSDMRMHRIVFVSNPIEKFLRQHVYYMLPSLDFITFEPCL